MVINMDEAKVRSVAQLQEFLDATQEIKFTGAPGEGDQQRYEHIRRVLKRLAYPNLGKGDRGVVLAYLRCTSGYSRSQASRLVGRWESNRLTTVPLAKRYARPTVPFARKYTGADIELLVEMDRANEDVCGPAIVHLLQRAFCVYGDQRYERLSALSLSHLYNLPKSGGYRALRSHFTKTRTVCNPIGVRKAPRPHGRAGWVRIDSVHQGDLDGVKGVYHNTCVDAVSQWQVQPCVQGISEAFLLPVLAMVIDQFPFQIEGFHSDNGSEYIHKVAKMLEKLRIEHTKSRSRNSNDNALAESNNASVVRQHMGYSHIPQKYAKPINAFYQEVFNDWLNLHRPCLFATAVVRDKGKIKKGLQAQGHQDPAGVPGATQCSGFGGLQECHHAGQSAGQSQREN